MHIVIVRFLYITYQGTHKVTILHIIIIMEDKCVSSFNIPVTLFHSSIIRQMAPRISWILLWQLRAKNSSPFKLCKAEAEIERGSAEKCSQISSTWEDSYCRRADKNRQWVSSSRNRCIDQLFPLLPEDKNLLHTRGYPFNGLHAAFS